MDVPGENHDPATATDRTLPFHDDASIRDLVLWATRELAAAGIESPRVDAELLLAHVLGLERGELLRRMLLGMEVGQGSIGASGTCVINSPVISFVDLVAQRAQRFPLQHLTGSAPFRELELEVGPGVFVPRPETEIVAQVAIDELRAREAFNATVVPISSEVAQSVGNAQLVAVDLCTGSGAIALALATEVPAAQVHGVELSHEAFEYTLLNNERYQDVVHLVRGDARTALQDLNGSVDVVVSNPPYVPPGAIPKDREVAEHDPELALYGLGSDGLEVPRGITQAAARLLKAGGLFVMEHAEVQDAAARSMLEHTQYFERVGTRLDLTNRPRMVVAYRNSVAYAEGPSK